MSDERAGLITYRYLRIAIVGLVLLLFTAIAWQVGSSDPLCLQRSISAYFFTAARSVFVVSLFAIVACLVVYRGDTEPENVLLDFSGFLALLVALVPTGVDTTCEAANVPSDEVLDAAVRNNVGALFIAASLTLIAAAVLERRLGRAPRTTSPTWTIVVGFVALVAGATCFVAFPDFFRDRAHTIAAIALFASFVLVVALNARAARPGSAVKRLYWTVAGLMIGTVVVVVGAHLLDEQLDQWSFIHWLFVLEAALILEFAAYWAIQTVELWEVTTRHDLTTEEAS